MRAYDELYLGNARKVLANMLDHAVNRRGIDLDKFFALFKISTIANRFQNGDCSLIAGRSGAELCEMVMEESGIEAKAPVANSAVQGTVLSVRSREYWAGWALAYYQWFSGLSFEQIDRNIPINEIREMHSPYHEMDIRSFCDEMDRRLAAKQTQETRLRFYRMRLGLSQRQLAEAADIPLRTIQQYEQRQKNINHARSVYMLSLSKVLRCSQQDLMEKDYY